jgi:hypothetical protein
MLLRFIITRCLSVVSLLVVSSLVQAGSPSSSAVIVGPLATSSVPTLSGNLLIVLGLLLAVIAARTLRNNQGAQKLLSILVLGGGLIISGIGVDRTMAIVVNTVTATGSVCTQTGPLQYTASVNTKLQNDCTNSIAIKGFSTNCTYGLNTATAVCKQGDVLTAGSSCSYLPLCNIPPG